MMGITGLMLSGAQEATANRAMRLARAERDTGNFPTLDRLARLLLRWQAESRLIGDSYCKCVVHIPFSATCQVRRFFCP
jgi:hypothetical protein